MAKKRYSIKNGQVEQRTTNQELLLELAKRWQMQKQVASYFSISEDRL